MGIRVILKDHLKNYANENKEIYAEGDTVGELLIDISNRYPDLRNAIFGRENTLLVLTLFDGKVIQKKEVNKDRISEKNSITIHQIIGGG